MGCGSQVVETPTHFQCQAGIAKQAENEKKAREFEAAHVQDGKRRKRYKVPDEDKPCPFLVPRTVCKREITREEALDIIGPNKKTALLTDFTSRFGRPFSAMLFLKENGRHGFEFAPRAPRGKEAKAADGEAGATPEAVAPDAEPAPAKGAGKSPKRGAAPKPAKAKAPTKKAARKKA
jgi:hypothetical protein